MSEDSCAICLNNYEEDDNTYILEAYVLNFILNVL